MRILKILLIIDRFYVSQESFSNPAGLTGITQRL